MFVNIFRNTVRWLVNEDPSQKLMLFGGHGV